MVRDPFRDLAFSRFAGEAVRAKSRFAQQANRRPRSLGFPNSGLETIEISRNINGSRLNFAAVCSSERIQRLPSQRLKKRWAFGGAELQFGVSLAQFRAHFALEHFH